MPYQFTYPIASAWNSIPSITNIAKGLLLDGYWHPSRLGFYIVLYDLDNNLLVKFLDESVLPHVKARGSVNPGISDLPVTEVEMYDALTESKIVVSQIPTMEQNLFHNFNLDKQVEALNKAVDPNMVYFHETGLTPGTLISIHQDQITELIQKTTSIKQELTGAPPEILELAELNMPLLEMDLPNLDRIAVDVEVASPRGIFPVPEDANFKINAIAIYGRTTEKGEVATIWMLSYPPTTSQISEIEQELGYLPEIRHFIHEKRLLENFFEEIRSYPIVLSYNGDNFDLPYLKHRAIKLGLEPPIKQGFIHGFYHRPQYHFLGSIHLDLFRFFANNSVRLYVFDGKYSRLGLSDVSEALLGVSKLEHDLWFDEMSRSQMVNYNIRDVELTHRLTTFSNNLALSVMLLIMRVGKMTLTQVNRASISSWVLNWIAHEHARQGWILPDRQALREKGVFDSDASIEGKQYQGAIVFEPLAGIYWEVLVADYASLYPSVIKKFRLSYETLRCSHDRCKTNTVPELSHWVCHRQGIMSSLVGYVRDIRVKWYKMLAKSGKSQQIKTLSKSIQAALKVFINASYGVFGNSKFALFCPPVAESTTAYSRDALKQAKHLAEQMGYDVIYGDTDSIFIHKMDRADFMKLKAWSIVDLGIELGIDYNFRYLVLTSRKKNYFGIKDDGGTITKGLQVKKSNTSQFIKDLFNDILNDLTEVQSPEDLDHALQLMKLRIQEVRGQLRAGSLPMAQLARMVTLSKAFNQYQTKTPTVQVAIQSITEENEAEFKRGTQFMIVAIHPREFVVQCNLFPKFRMGHPMTCKYAQVSQVDPMDIDWSRYETELKKAFVPIFHAFGLSWEEDINKQTSLDQFLNSWVGGN